jgi:hypothetical protein
MRRRAALPRFVLGLAVLVVSGACADDSFTVRVDPAYPRHPARVSVLGVFKEGRMNSDAWDATGRVLSSPFSGSGDACETAYGERLAAASPGSMGGAMGAIDDYTRANGITDDLLALLAPMAAGDAIVVFTVAGRPPASGGGAGEAHAPPMQTPPVTGGGRRMGGMGAPPPRTPSERTRRSDSNVFQIAASVYSLELRRSAVLVEMTYSGDSIDEALKKFARRLGAELRGAVCVGWRSDVKLDEEKVRALPEP